MQILQFNIFGPSLNPSETTELKMAFPNAKIRDFPFAFELDRAPSSLRDVYKLLRPALDKLAAAPYRRGVVDLFICPFIKSTPVDCLASKDVDKERHWFVLTGQKENQVHAVSDCGVPLPLDSHRLLESDRLLVTVLKESISKLFVLNGFRALCRSLDLAESVVRRGPTSLLHEAMAERIQTLYPDLAVRPDRYALIDGSKHQELATGVSDLLGGQLSILGRTQIKKPTKEEKKYCPILLTRHLFSEETWRAKQAALQHPSLHPSFLIVAMDQGEMGLHASEILDQAFVQLCQL